MAWHFFVLSLSLLRKRTKGGHHPRRLPDAAHGVVEGKFRISADFFDGLDNDGNLAFSISEVFCVTPVLHLFKSFLLSYKCSTPEYL